MNAVGVLIMPAKKNIPLTETMRPCVNIVLLLEAKLCQMFVFKVSCVLEHHPCAWFNLCIKRETATQRCRRRCFLCFGFQMEGHR